MVEAEVEERWTAGRAAWPDCDVSLATFAAWLAQHPEATRAYAADHYLACGCLARMPAAIAAFSKRYLADVERYLGSLASSSDIVDEVRQRLAIRLLVGDDGRGPRLADYTGKGSLEGWLRVAASRLAIDLKRGERLEPDLGALVERIEDPRELELSFLRSRYLPHFQRALETALVELAAEHRLLLRLHFLEGMTTAAMAAFFRVSRATIVRRITDAKTALYEGVARDLSQRLGLTTSAFAELLSSIRSALEVSAMRLLTEP